MICSDSCLKRRVMCSWKNNFYVLDTACGYFTLQPGEADIVTLGRIFQ